MKLEGLTVGIPKEVMEGENRVAATPETVKEMVENGAKVLVEKGAGIGALYDDDQYREAGAEIIPDPSEIFGNSDIVLKVKEPLYNEKAGKSEEELLSEKQVLISFLHPANPSNHDTVRKLAQRGVISFTMDSIPRISRAQKMDALTSMSTVAGYKSVIIAANNLSKFVPKIPIAAGNIEQAQFLVVGTGVVGLQAVSNAKRLGAKVKSIDIRPEANEQAKSLGAETIPFDVPEELAVGEGGYARRLPEEWYEREREVLMDHIKESDAVITTALIPGEKSPVLITEDMISEMKKGSVIVDVSIDQGGNCEVTKGGELYEYKGVKICGPKNIPASVASDATNMYARNLWNFLDYIVEDGKVNTESEDEIIEKSIVTKDNEIVHEGTLLAMESSEEE